MKLKELKDVITEDSTVYLQTNKGTGLPLMYPTWRECKHLLKQAAWEEEIELVSYSGIMILFKNL